MKFKDLLSKNSKAEEEAYQKIGAECAANQRIIVYKAWNSDLRDALQKDEATLDSLRQKLASMHEYELLGFFKTSKHYAQVSSKLAGLREHLQEQLDNQMEKIANTTYFTSFASVFSDEAEARFLASIPEGDLIEVVSVHDKEKMAKYDKYLRPDNMDEGADDLIRAIDPDTLMPHWISAKRLKNPPAGKRPTLKKEEVE
jgi:predicted SnoaL-like aldol condensation-catalyzing enzyme